MTEIGYFLEQNKSFVFYLNEHLKVYQYSKELEQKLRIFKENPCQLGDWSFIKGKMESASQEVNYYSEVNWKNIDFWKNLKFIDKEELRKNYEFFINSHYNIDELWVRPTTGSTGKSMNILYTPEFSRELQQTTLYKIIHTLNIPDCKSSNSVLCLNVHNRVTLNDVVWINIIPPAKLVARIILDEKDLASFKKILAFLTNYSPDIFSLKPSILRAILSFLKKNPTITVPTMPTIISGGAYLSEELRQIVESKFKTKVYNAYGLTEFGGIAVECSLQEGMHVYQTCAFFC